ncbi:uncharacterized protein [Equus przewalskii]|uniref:Uncharacterized protein n=1 Tax=Equus przewalskii TaxID=9798 RepID=A0ABM4JI50_EQUPR
MIQLYQAMYGYLSSHAITPDLYRTGPFPGNLGPRSYKERGHSATETSQPQASRNPRTHKWPQGEHFSPYRCPPRIGSRLGTVEEGTDTERQSTTSLNEGASAQLHTTTLSAGETIATFSCGHTHRHTHAGVLRPAVPDTAGLRPGAETRLTLRFPASSPLLAVAIESSRPRSFRAALPDSSQHDSADNPEGRKTRESRQPKPPVASRHGHPLALPARDLQVPDRLQRIPPTGRRRCCEMRHRLSRSSRKFVSAAGSSGTCSVAWERHRAERVALIAQAQARGGCGASAAESRRPEHLAGGRDDRAESEEPEGEASQGPDSSQACWGEGHGGDPPAAQATQPALAFTGDKQKEEPEDLESLAEVCAVWIGVILPSTLPLFQDLTHFENEQDWSKGKDLSFPKRDPGPQALVKNPLSSMETDTTKDKHLGSLSPPCKETQADGKAADQQGHGLAPLCK